MSYACHPTKCLECNEEFLHGEKLSTHLKKIHNLTFKDYVIKHKYNGIQPMCKHCGKETRWRLSFELGFNDYCSDCSHIAESEAGKIGGKIKQTWSEHYAKLTK